MTSCVRIIGLAKRMIWVMYSVTVELTFDKEEHEETDQSKLCQTLPEYIKFFRLMREHNEKNKSEWLSGTFGLALCYLGCRSSAVYSL